MLYILSYMLIGASIKMFSDEFEMFGCLEFSLLYPLILYKARYRLLSNFKEKMDELK